MERVFRLREGVRCDVGGFRYPSFWRISRCNFRCLQDVTWVIWLSACLRRWPHHWARVTCVVFFDDNLHVPIMFYYSPSPRSMLLCAMCTYQLNPRPPPTMGQGGDMWEMVLQGMADPWGWWISQDLLWSKSGSEVGICLVPTFLPFAISSRDYWYFDDSSAMFFCFRVWLCVTTTATKLSCFTFNMCGF